MAGSRGLQVADAEDSRQRLLEALDDTPGIARDIVLLNAGAALYTAGLANSIGEGIERARTGLSSGAARARLQQFIATTQQLAAAP